MYSFLVDGKSEHKKTKGVNKNVAATISFNDSKYVLLNNKCLRHSMKWIQIKDQRIGTHEIIRISRSCFDDKKHILNSRYDGLALGYQS